MNTEQKRRSSVQSCTNDKYNDVERNDQIFIEEYMKPYFVDLFKDLARRCK